MEFKDQVKNASLGRTHVWYMGQAGFLIKNRKGELLGHDLYLSDFCERRGGVKGFHRLQPKVLSPSDLAFDCLLASHAHGDHFDYDALPLQMKFPGTKLFCSTGCRSLVEETGIAPEQVVYVKKGETRILGDYTIHFIDSDHGEAAPDSYGVIIETDGLRILEVGDTSLHLEWKDQYIQYGPIDLMFAPINGKWGNLNNRECLKLVEAVSPRFFVPNHFGMCALHGGNPEEFCSLMENLPSQRWSFLTVGEEIFF